jgi:hypothetical protein
MTKLFRGAMNHLQSQTGIDVELLQNLNKMIKSPIGSCRVSITGYENVLLEN